MCPDSALLVAYADGTLFSRDAAAVEQHIQTCARCSTILAAMRQERVVARPSIWAHPWTIGVATTVVVIVGIGTWAVLPGSKSAPSGEVAPARSETARPAALPGAAASSAPTAPEVSNASEAPATQPAQRPNTNATERLRPPVTRKTPPKPATGTEKASRAIAAPAATDAIAVDPVANPDQADTGVTLRGRNANRRILWRTRDLVVEHSTDGGTTWVAEHTADRPIRAGTFVDANVAWLVGENGLVLRRTKNGWFGTSPPADGHINAVRASSPSKATLTLDDGRVFNTEDGGVTWSAQ